ncbi:MAG: SpoIID/LytB domain-containing protein [Eubacterium sp.]|nr:SpoIID/LytB domain-containing protein [Eubacterium sp.]
MRVQRIIIGFWVILIIIIILTVSKSSKVYQESGRTIVIPMKNARMKMDLEQFIPLVLMAEMPFDSPKELLKAHAVVIRTNILYTMRGKKIVEAQELGLPFKTPEQLKRQWEAEERMFRANGLSGILLNGLNLGKEEVFAKKMNELYELINETEGRVLKIEGKLVLPLFHQLSNGKTRDGATRMGKDYGYMTAVACDEDMENPGYEVYQRIGVEEIIRKLNRHRMVVFQKGKEVDLKNIKGEELVRMLEKGSKDTSGYWNHLVLGDVRIEGMDFAKALGLPTCAFDMEAEGDEIVFCTRGNGHGFGMSLNDARTMALQGKHYNEILKKFYQAALVKNVS